MINLYHTWTTTVVSLPAYGWFFRSLRAVVPGLALSSSAVGGT